MTSRLDCRTKTGFDPAGTPTKGAFSASSWPPAAKIPQNGSHLGFGELFGLVPTDKYQWAIDAWLDVRSEGPLLTRVPQTGVVSLLPMTAQSLMARLWKRGREARVAPCSSHDLRRSFVSAGP